MPTNRVIAEEDRVETIISRLAEYYPQAVTRLRYHTPFQLLVAAVLSAQTTDKQVNRITPQLCRRAPTPRAMAAMQPDEIAEYIKGCGLYRHKSRYLAALSRIIIEKYAGRPPATLHELMALPGVGRKTANVVLNNAFGVPALAVDTHVFRVSRRLGLSDGSKVEEVEKELTRKIPPDKWGEMHHRLIAHGRQVCTARKPGCYRCLLADFCPSKKNYPEGEG